MSLTKLMIRRRKGPKPAAPAPCRALALEVLEPRRLLAGPTADQVDPLAHGHAAPLDTDVSATYDRDLDPLVWQSRTQTTGGSGLFRDSGQSLGASRSFDVALGDLDDDGDFDAFVANWVGNRVWLNDGRGRFSSNGQRLSYSLGAAVALGDVDDDGDLDAFVGNGYRSSGEPNQVWLNDGRGHFTDSRQELGDSCTAAVALGDVDGDGDLDAFVGNASPPDAPNKVWLNDGQGRFSDSGQELGNADTQAVALGDLDGDGDLDAFAGNGDIQPNRVWLNDGQGNFSSSGQGLGQWVTRGVALGDVDADGDLDVLAANYHENRVWLNDGEARFADSGQQFGGRGGRAVALKDLDGDDDLDAFVGVSLGSDSSNQVWLNDGQGNFSDSQQRLGDAPSAAVALEDLDGDGDPDAFVANDLWQANRVWLGDGEGRFSDSGQNLGGTFTRCVALGDLDADGDLDAFVANYLLNCDPNKVWINDGQGRFDDSGQRLGRSLSYAVALGDLDGDGDLDAFIGNATPWGGQPDEVWFNDGLGHFTDSGRRIGNSRSEAVALGDLDGDGDLDAFVGARSSSKVWLNDGQGIFRDLAQTLDGSGSPALGDVDGDGDLDVFLSTNDGPGEVWLNDGQAQFSNTGQSLGDCEVAALGDLDADGDLDAFAGRWGPNKVWLNDGQGRFVDSGQSLDDSLTTALALGDLDDDGDLDAFVANRGSSSGAPDTVWLNDGQGRFRHSGQGLGNWWTTALALGDLDADGDLDAFYADRHETNKVWLNQASAVAGRYLFYNNSCFDTATAEDLDLDDDTAIAPDKTALRPGGTATFENYTSYSRGINGIMVDIAGLPPAGDAINADDDFRFNIGNTDDPTSWAPAPDPTSVSLRRGEGTGSSDRLTIIWDDNAIQKQWLQVTVLVTENTGLERPDVFYFGNAIGESGNSTSDAKVNAYDMLGARDNQRTFVSPAAIDFDYDYDRDARVNAYDMLIARDNQTHFLNALKLISVPPVEAPPNQSRGGDILRDQLSWLYEFDPRRTLDRSSGNGEGHDGLLEKAWAAYGL